MTVFCLTGDSDFLINKKIEEISRSYKVLYYNNNFTIFFSDLQKLSNRSLFAQKEDLVLKNLDKLTKEDFKKIVETIKNIEGINFIFVFSKENIDFFSCFKKNNIRPYTVPVFSPTEKNLSQFIKDYFKSKQINIPNEIVEILKENYKKNIDLLLIDLERYFALHQEFKTDKIKEFFHFKTNNFKIQELFLERNWPAFIHHFKKFILEDKSRDHFETFALLTLLYRSLIKILFIKQNLIKEKRNKYKNFYFKKLVEKSKNLELKEIKLLLSSLAKTDKKLKKFLINIKEIPEDIAFNYLSSLKIE
jgi:DNA polymerase III delta subunit